MERRPVRASAHQHVPARRLGDGAGGADALGFHRDLVGEPDRLRLPVAALRLREAGRARTSRGATASTYMLVAADVGSTLRVRVTATNGAGSSSADSAQTAVVTAAPSGVPPGFTSVVRRSRLRRLLGERDHERLAGDDRRRGRHARHGLRGAGLRRCGRRLRSRVRARRALARPGPDAGGEPGRPADAQQRRGARVRALRRLRSHPAPVEPGGRLALELDQPLDRRRRAQQRQLLDPGGGVRAGQRARSSCASTASTGSR